MNIENQLKTGDILLFQGESGSSKLISFFTRSKFTHVSFVWKCPITFECYLFESDYTTGSKLIVDEHCLGAGSHLVSLKEKLKYYKGNVYWRKLKNSNKKFNFSSSIQLDKYLADNIGREYPLNVPSLWSNDLTFFDMAPIFLKKDKITDRKEYKQILKSKTNNCSKKCKKFSNKDVKKVRELEWFCCQVIFWTYVFLDVLKFNEKDKATFCLTPKDFVTDENLYFINNFYLGKLIPFRIK